MERLQPFLIQFENELAKYYELSIDQYCNGLGLLTIGSGESYVQRLADFLTQEGIEKEKIDLLKSSAKLFDYKSVFFKVDLGPKGLEEFSFYFRKRAVLNTVQQWMSIVNLKHTKTIQQLLFLLNKPHVQGLAMSFTKNAENAYKVYITLPGGYLNSWHRVGVALTKTIQIKPSVWSNLIQLLQPNYRYRIFYSNAFIHGEIVPIAQIYMFQVPLSIVQELFKQYQFPSGSLKQVEGLLQMSSKDHIDYLALKLSKEKLLGVKTYFFEEIRS